MDYDKEELNLLIKIIYSHYNKNYIDETEKLILQKLLKKMLIRKIDLLSVEIENGTV